MSERRFTTKNIICSNYCVWDNDGKSYGNDEVVELLNTFYDENQELKEKNDFLKRRLDCIIDSLQYDLNNYGMMGETRMTQKRFRSGDEISINLDDLIDKHFRDCKYYSKPLFGFGYFTLGYCDNPKHCKSNLELCQCMGSYCEDIEILK